MKLIIRSQYWGNTLRGKTRIDPCNPAISYRMISAQAVLTVEGKYWGCCQTQGKRVLEMTERHFTDFHSGDWDLYLVAHTTANHQDIYTFYLLPQGQTAIDVSMNSYYLHWMYIDSIPAESIRQRLKDLLTDYLLPNESIGYHHHHVHIDILMPEVIDYAARERKAKANSDLASATESADPEPERENHKSPLPPIEKTNSIDATSTTEASSPVTTASYQEIPARFVHTTPFDHDVAYPVAMQYHPGMQHFIGPSMYPHSQYGYSIIPSGISVPVHHMTMAYPYMHAYPPSSMHMWSPPRHHEKDEDQIPEQRQSDSSR